MAAPPAASALEPAARSFLRGKQSSSAYRLPAEAPVLPTVDGWVISGHPEVCRLAGDRRLVIDPRAGDPPVPLTQSERLESVLARMLNFRDGADHARLRRLATVAFSARRANAVAETVAAVVGDLADAALARGEFDAVADVGVPLPVRTTCALLDIPRADRQQVADWSTAMSAQLFTFKQPPDAVEAVERQLAELTGYIDDLARHRRRGDLVADLHAALDHDEFVAFVVLLFMNGLETVTAGIARAIGALAWQPGLADRIRRDPGSAGDVFAELMRLHSPVRLGARRAAEPIDAIPRGAPVFLAWSLANRDPRVFTDPDTFRPGRPGRSLAFGAGPHHCLGAALAGQQGAAVLRAFATRARLTCRTDEAGTPRLPGAAIDGFSALRVVAEPLMVGVTR
ncbi:cytochrome P450 [Phytohabitans sp. ZYX-F-186]|uniref:Cytochrome P450 n=1 Tax=Phytohabitans maris TaxID=3071409 RepID=A0ABU0ZAT5_9ACTN|nr:cytochrome P450 [Phytohabitans sp. ZYX-F-186]MDQ7904153.1 cytochrome P450 [Phytohabitans sp. ZYX-F-186]